MTKTDNLEMNVRPLLESSFSPLYKRNIKTQTRKRKKETQLYLKSVENMLANILEIIQTFLQWLYSWSSS